jgi:sugar phosphate isomerase/epimerase
MKIEQVALQLYTVRDACQDGTGLAATIRRIREIGFQAVQVSGIGPVPYPEVRAICEGEGVTICATHEPSAVLRENPAEAVARLKELGCRMTAYPFPRDVDFTNPGHVSEMIADLARAGEAMADAGITFNYHNHAIEFIRVGGKTILERIFDDIPAAKLGAELDTYWVQYGGGNPVEWCKKLTGRLHMLHLKDYAFTAENTPVFAEIGIGNLDFAAIISAAEEAGCKWFAVEQDVCPGDPFVSARQSFEFIRNNLVKN